MTLSVAWTRAQWSRAQGRTPHAHNFVLGTAVINNNKGIEVTEVQGTEVQGTEVQVTEVQVTQVQVTGGIDVKRYRAVMINY